MKAKPGLKVVQSTVPYPDIIDQPNPKDPLLLLAAKMAKLEAKFAPLYVERHTGKADLFDEGKLPSITNAREKSDAEAQLRQQTAM